MKLSDVITKELIQIPLNAGSKEGVIREMVLHLKEKNKIDDANTTFDIIMERERIMTTGIGHGIAIPHGKSPILNEIIVTLGIRPEGIEFEALDKQPVNIVFLLLTSEKDKGIHIRLLSRISRILNRPECRTALIQSTSADEALTVIKNAEQEWFEL